MSKLTLTDVEWREFFIGGREGLFEITSTRSGIDKNNFAYRFCYSLRNFSQHIDLPINEVKATSPDDETVTIDFYIDLDYLLNSNFNWKKLKKELIELKKEKLKIDVIDLVKDYFHALTELYGNYSELFLELNHNKLVSIKSKLENLNLKHAKYYISKISKYDLKYNPSNHTFSPIAAFAEIDEIYIEPTPPAPT